MININNPGSILIGENQPEYQPIYAKVITEKLEVEGKILEVKAITMEFEFSDEELELLCKNKRIIYTQIGNYVKPFQIKVKDQI